MSALQRKLWRDVRQSAVALLIVVLIIAVGTGSFICTGTAQRILETSQRVYYESYRFADFWIDVKKAPLTAVKRIGAIPGVEAVEPRIAFDVILDLPNVERPLSGRLLSTPAHNFENVINGVHLVRGSGFSDDRNEEVILGEAFAQAHGLQPGDRIGLILNRKRESFVIVGTAISPEYVYMVRGEGDIVPDPEHFGILYIKERYAREVLDFQDACNQIVGRIVPGAAGDIDLLLDRMDRMLEPYGVLAKYPRARQASHRFLSDEIAGLGVTAVAMPSIFLLVAALVLNILMSRLAERQRTVIGTLKALGYANREILRHYLGFGVIVGLAGGVAGIVLGLVLAAGMIEMYKRFFQFPEFIWTFHVDLLLLGMAISLLFAIAGTVRGVRLVLRLQPAEAMRPKPPERGGAMFLERFGVLWRHLSFRTHIALRSMARNRFRTGTGIMTSALATAIIVLTFMMYDGMWFLLDFQFDRTLHSDVDIGMREERSAGALYEAMALPGVDRAEAGLALVCDVRNGRYSRRLAITGLPRDHHLTTPLDANLDEIAIPPVGLVMTAELAELLHAHAGDRVTLTPIRGQRRTVSAPVTSIVEGFLGLSCYADRQYLSGLVDEGVAINSLQLAVDPTRQRALYAAIKQLPNAQGLSVRADTRRNIESTLITNISISIASMIVFAAVIALGSMLNASLIEIGDRTREIATLRVLGYTPGQVGGILLRQNLILAVIGQIIGIPLGYLLGVVVAQAYSTELFRMPVITQPGTYVLAITIVVAFVLVAQLFVYHQVYRLDWREGIKVKE